MRFRSPRDAPPRGSAYTAALTMLSRRELSTMQVRERLAERGYDREAIEEAVSRLTAGGTLDDRRVARALARTRAQVRRQGRDRVRRELAAIGIARDVADEAVAEVFGDLDERALLDQALARRMKRGTDLADPAARRRIYGALVRQGFAPDAIGRALRTATRTSKIDE